LVRYIASRWVSEFNGALNPSLIAFITYGEGNKTWTVITAIPYKPSWVVNQEPIEITVNANFTAVKPAIVMPVTKPTSVGKQVSESTNTSANTNPRPSMLTGGGGGGGSGSVYDYTYVGSCMGNANVYPPPPPQSPPSCGKYGTQCYYWALQQCSVFEGPIPLLFVGWSQNAIQNVNSIVINNIGGTAQSGSGLFGTVNESGNLVLVGPTYTFSQSYTIEMANGLSGVNITYGSSLTQTISYMTIPALMYTVPSSGYFYVGLPGRIAYVAFQEYLDDEPLNNWANGTEPLSLLPQDFFDNKYLCLPIHRCWQWLNYRDVRGGTPCLRDA